MIAVKTKVIYVGRGVLRSSSLPAAGPGVEELVDRC